MQLQVGPVSFDPISGRVRFGSRPETYRTALYLFSMHRAGTTYGDDGKKIRLDGCRGDGAVPAEN